MTRHSVPDVSGVHACVRGVCVCVCVCVLRACSVGGTRGADTRDVSGVGPSNTLIIITELLIIIR